MRAVQDWFALMLYVLCWVLDFCKLKIPDTVFPFAVLSESADGKAWSMGVNEPVGGGVVEGGGGGVVDGGGSGGGGGGGGGWGGGGAASCWRGGGGEVAVWFQLP